VRLGTAIVQTYPRHPLALAQQALVLNDIAPGRLRLGIGPSHRPIIEGIFGLPQRKPLAHLREYVEVLRGILWEGKVNYHGEFFNVEVTSPSTPRIPILISTLGEKAFQLAGEIADGALFMVMPCSISTPYRIAGITERSSYHRTISPSFISSTCTSSTYHRSPLSNGSGTSIA
jgi:alkanesulfonate monooxygenase SsuD/methylene tetrahydromethanopterin reductase-like flavin-dependent oxidoreductase (luciferase family)